MFCVKFYGYLIKSRNFIFNKQGQLRCDQERFSQSDYIQSLVQIFLKRCTQICVHSPIHIHFLLGISKLIVTGNHRIPEFK